MKNDIVEKFDDFKYFNQIIRTNRNPNGKGKNPAFVVPKISVIEDCRSMESTDFSHIPFDNIYHFYSRFDRDYLIEKANEITSHKFKILVLDIIYSFEKYEQYIFYEFMDFVYETNFRLKEPFDSKKFDVPCNIYSICRYVTEWTNKQNANEFAKKLALLMSFLIRERYDEGDLEENKWIKNFVSSIVTHIIENVEIRNKTTVFNSLCIQLSILNNGDYEELAISLNQFIKKQSKELFYIPDDGLIAIPWTCVFFLNGAILLSHPNYPLGSVKAPFRLEVQDAKKVFNKIKTIFVKSLPEIRVQAKGGRIISVIDIPNIEACIQVLDHHIRDVSEHDVFSNMKERLKCQDYSEGDVLQYISSLKSEYLNFLAEIHLNNYRITYSIELRQNNNDLSIEEDSFIFILKETTNSLIILFENALSSRSSILFHVSKDFLEESVKQISNFFSSITINKREKIMSKSIDFSIEGIQMYDRIIHDDFNSWKASINFLLNKWN